MRNETAVDPTRIREEIEGLRSLSTSQLKEKYRDVFGESSRSNHKQFLFRRVAWRIQANAWGGLSERARRRALEIAAPTCESARRRTSLRTPSTTRERSKRG